MAGLTHQRRAKHIRTLTLAALGLYRRIRAEEFTTWFALLDKV